MPIMVAGVEVQCKTCDGCAERVALQCFAEFYDALHLLV